jgi:hypothetical protein
MDTPMPGHSNRALKVAVISTILLVLALIFGFWAFSGRQNYKNNADKLVAQAVILAKNQQAANDKIQYDNLLKQPYKAFTGPATYGTISFNYPKTWSVYNDQTSQNEPINAYFYPDQVPGAQSDVAYPLRVELLNQDYNDVVDQFTAQVTQGNVTSVAYMPPKMKGVSNAQPGVKLDGNIGQSASGTALKGSMVIIKVRDKTLQIYTETTSGVDDFNNVILSSLTFVP